MKNQDPRESAPTPSLREIGGAVFIGAKKGSNFFLLGGEGRESPERRFYHIFSLV